MCVLWLVVRCLLFVLWFVVGSPFDPSVVVWSLLIVEYWLLFIICIVVCRLVFVVCCVMFIVYSLLFVGVLLLFNVCVFVVC